jgi:hypothetical protein
MVGYPGFQVSSSLIVSPSSLPPFVDRHHTSFSSGNPQPLRQSGLTNSFASSLFVKRTFLLSRINFWPGTRLEIVAMKRVSVYGPATPKLDKACLPARHDSTQLPKTLIPHDLGKSEVKQEVDLKISSFVTKAFRRTPTGAELKKYHQVYQRHAQVESPSMALLSAYKEILCSPKFLLSWTSGKSRGGRKCELQTG